MWHAKVFFLFGHCAQTVAYRVQKEVVVECYGVLPGILLEILRKTTKIMPGKCVTWRSFEPGTSRIQNRSQLEPILMQYCPIWSNEITCSGFLSVIIIWNYCNLEHVGIVPLDGFCLLNFLQHVWVQSSNTDLCSSGAAAGATDLFGLTQLHHEVRRASVCPHHSRMEKTVHKLWGGTLKCAQPICVCAEVLCLLLNTILRNLKCTIYSWWITCCTWRVKLSIQVSGKNCIVCDVCHSPVYISHFDGFTFSLLWLLNFPYV